MGLAKLLKEVANFRTGGHNVQTSARQDDTVDLDTVDLDDVATNLRYDSAPAQVFGSPTPAVRVKPGNVGNTI